MNALTQAAAEDTSASSRQYIHFHIGEHAFALPLEALQEIIRVPPIAHVPLSPPSLKGLANYRGVVLPVIDLHHLFSMVHTPDNLASRVLVFDLDKPVGVIVDRVSGIFVADSRQIDNNTDMARVDHSYLAGMIRHHGEAIMLISFDKILAREFVAVEGRRSVQFTAGTEADTEAEVPEVRLVTFAAEEQEYAFHIDQVEEIVFLSRILHIPNVEPTVAGVIQLHERLLPVFHLRALLSLPPVEYSPQNRIVIVSVQLESGQQAVGLLVDAVREIVQVPQTSLEQVPQFFGFDSPNAEITAICRIPGQERLISILSSEAMFGMQKIRDLLHSLQDATGGDTESAAVVAEAETQLLVFRLLEEELALPVEVVQEIVRVPELAKVPQAPEFIAGVFNYRGVVTPVVNQRRRLGFLASPDLESQRVMVLDVKGIKTGFMVDAITEVLRVPDSALEAPPELFQSHLRMVQRIVHLGPDRMVLMLDTEQLLNSVEFKALSKVVKKEKTN